MKYCMHEILMIKSRAFQITIVLEKLFQEWLEDTPRLLFSIL